MGLLIPSGAQRRSRLWNVSFRLIPRTRYGYFAGNVFSQDNVEPCYYFELKMCVVVLVLYSRALFIS